MAIEELRTYPGCRLPAQAAAIEELYDWSLNFNPGQNPYCVFLDLIGYSYETWEHDAYIAPHPSKGYGRYNSILGYKELCLLSDALKLYETHGHAQVYEWCSLLDESEMLHDS